MSKTKITQLIRADKVGKFNLWQAPAVAGNTVNVKKAVQVNPPSTGVNTPVTAQDMEEIRKTAYKEGFDKGQAEGLNKVKQQYQESFNSLNKLLTECQASLGKFDEQTCEQLVAMTISIAKQVIRRELSIAPDEIMAVIREAITCLPNSKEKLVLKLHPDDATLVKETYQLNNDPERMWTVLEDPNMQRGGCIISTESSTVNADLENRLAIIVTQLLGDERIENNGE